jgi:capsular exopolysaccharide synthesis family protein
VTYSPLPVPTRQGVPAEHGGHLPTTPGGWGAPPPLDPIGAGEPSTPWHRYFAALRRFRYLVVGCLIAGLGVGYAATRLVVPEYEAHGTIWITIAEDRRQSDATPIQADQLLNAATWDQLFRSLRVTDSVVLERKLYLHHSPLQDFAFVGFDVGPGYQAGSYQVLVTPDTLHYALGTPGRDGMIIERGLLGDSIGRKLGFRWRPSAASLRQSAPLRFSIESQHGASQGLADRVTTNLPDNSQFMEVTLTSDRGYDAAATLNAWMGRFVSVAADLKRRKVVELTSILGTQLQVTSANLRTAEQALENYQSGSVSHVMPNGGGASPVTPGGATGGQAPGGEGGVVSVAPGVGGGGANQEITAFYSNQVARDNLRQDIQRVTQILGTAGTPEFNPEDLLAVPSLMLNSDNLTNAIKAYSTKENDLRELRLKYTDDYKPVRDLETSITTLQTQTIPQAATQALNRLKANEQGLTQRVSTQSRDITQLPKAEIDFMRLKREVDQATALYTTLQGRYTEARLAGESAIPDVQILDRPVIPTSPSRNTKPRIMLMALAGGLGLGLALAILLDRLDRRMRYPEQATDELGLPIIGTVPMVRPRDKAAEEAEAAQVVEAFRTIRLNLMNLFEPGMTSMFTITSPGAGEGKSLISSNLAMSFAESGRRTLLIDGDIRRGQLHATFGIHQAPGVLDYLTGNASLEEVLQATDYEHLTVVACGARRHRGPELLASERMGQFLNTLRPHFDIIIVDSPPLGAGIDPLALGAATGHMMVVLRIGRSDRQMAQAKLTVVDRYPIRVLGCVLNDIKAEGAFRYYSYLYGYNLDDSERQAQLPSRVGEVGTHEEIRG